MRDRLIELCKKIPYGVSVGAKFEQHFCEKIADYLLANGVIVPPCKVGQTVYAVSNYYGGEWQIYECRVDNFTVYEKNTFMSISNPEGYNFGANICEIGKTVFLTREEAEKALMERSAK